MSSEWIGLTIFIICVLFVGAVLYWKVFNSAKGESYQKLLMQGSFIPVDKVSKNIQPAELPALSAKPVAPPEEKQG